MKKPRIWRYPPRLDHAGMFRSVPWIVTCHCGRLSYSTSFRTWDEALACAVEHYNVSHQEPTA